MQLRNVIKRHDVGNTSKNCFDARDNFFMLVLTAHNISATMHFLGMDVDDPNPIIIPPEVQQLGKEDKKRYLIRPASSLTPTSISRLSAVNHQMILAAALNVLKQLQI